MKNAGFAMGVMVQGAGSVYNRRRKDETASGRKLFAIYNTELLLIAQPSKSF